MTALVAMAVVGCDADGPTPERQAAQPADGEVATTASATPKGLAEPTATEPVVLWATVEPSAIRAGADVQLLVHAQMAAGWTIHPVDLPGPVGAAGPASPTTLELKLPRGVEATGVWELPAPQRRFDTPGAGPVYEGDVTFRRTLKIAAGRPVGGLNVGCVVGFQACDAEMCRRPEQRTLLVNVHVGE